MGPHRAVTLTAATALALALPVAASAQDAPPTDDGASADATALEVEDVLVISHSHAGEGEASSTSVEVFGETIAGSEQTEPGESGGEILGSGETPLGELTVGDHLSRVSEDGSSHAHSTLLEVTVIDSTVANVKVLASEADVAADGSSSSSSDGAVIDLGDGQLVVEVLHAETSSDGEGTVYLVSINGQRIGSDEQTDNAFCGIDARPLVAIDAICVSAQEGDQPVTAEVADVDALDDNVLAEIVTSTSTPAAAVTAGGGDVEGDVTQPRTDDEPGALPLTGGPFGLAALGALLALGAGTTLRRVRR